MKIISVIVLMTLGKFLTVEGASNQLCFAPRIVHDSYFACRNLLIRDTNTSIFDEISARNKHYDSYCQCILEGYGFLSDGKIDERKQVDFINKYVEHKGAAGILINYYRLCKNTAERYDPKETHTKAAKFMRCLSEIPNYADYFDKYVCER